MTVSPDSAAEPPSTWNTALAMLPLTVSMFAPGPVIVVAAVSVNSSAPPVKVIVCGVSNRLEKTIESSPPSAFAWATAARNEPAPLSSVLVTVNCESSARPSSAITAGRTRRSALRFLLICCWFVTPRFLMVYRSVNRERSYVRIHSCRCG